MLDFVFNRKFFRIRQMAFSRLDEINKRRCDVICLHSNENAKKHSDDMLHYAKEQTTLVNDLTEDEDSLLSKIKKNCRYEIRRAEREGCYVDYYGVDQNSDYNSVLSGFRTTYNAMFSTKGISGYAFNESMIKAGLKAGNVIISVCTSQDSQQKVYHAYLCDGNCTMLLYSASPLWNEGDKDLANLIGRMNKFLHWKDICWFRNQGYSKYEWGGIWSVDNPNGIDRFKMEFGGEPEIYVNYTIARSLKGIFYTWLLRRKEQGRSNHESNS